jgi:hypothetical protein
MPGRNPVIAGECQATACRVCVWGPEAQRVRRVTPRVEPRVG